MPVVPTEFISTDEAIQQFISEDPAWQTLQEHWNDSNGADKDRAHADMRERRDALSIEFESAVLRGDLAPIAIKRMNGKWVEHRLPPEYWETPHGNLALWTGEVVRLGLPPNDQWIADAPLCLRREKFQTWKNRQAAVGSVGPPSRRWMKTREAVRKWLLEQYPSGTAKTHKTLANECSKSLRIPVSDRTIRRALGGR